MKIGDLAQQLGTTVRTLRFYEEQGLVHPYRSAGGTRQYQAETVARFQAILELARAGIPLRDLRLLAAARENSVSGDQASHRVATRLQQLVKQLEQRRVAIVQAQADIECALGFVRQCFGCQRSPSRTDCANCPVALHRSDVSVLNLIWDEAQQNVSPDVR